MINRRHDDRRIPRAHHHNYHHLLGDDDFLCVGEQMPSYVHAQPAFHDRPCLKSQRHVVEEEQQPLGY